MMDDNLETDCTTAAARNYFCVKDLGVMDYAPCFQMQQQINQSVIDGTAQPTLLLVEHNPVITISHKKDSSKHLVAAPEVLSQLGIDLQETNRGGDITYHGPGQLVVYPILKLAPLKLNLSRYMRFLEDIVISTISRYGIKGNKEPGATGVWVDAGLEVQAKICAMGVRIRKNSTMHGLALNVDTDLSHFDTIIPCGLQGRKATSLQALLGAAYPDMAQVKKDIVEEFEHAVLRQL